MNTINAAAPKIDVADGDKREPSFLIQAITSHFGEMDDSEGMWKGRAIAFVAGLTRSLCFLRDRGYLAISVNTYVSFMKLDALEALVFDRTITVDGEKVIIEDADFDVVNAPLKSFLGTLLDYSLQQRDQGYSPVRESLRSERHGYLTLQISRVLQSSVVDHSAAH